MVSMRLIHQLRSRIPWRLNASCLLLGLILQLIARKARHSHQFVKNRRTNRSGAKIRNLNPPDMKKLLLLSLFVVVYLVADISVRVIATTATTVTESTLTNISTRAFVQTGDNLVIGGFIVDGAQPKRVIIRAIGPELTQYGVPNALANPTLELHDGTGALIASNNNWVTTIIGGIITSNQVHEIQASGYAPSDPFESAIIADLPAGKLHCDRPWCKQPDWSCPRGSVRS